MSRTPARNSSLEVTGAGSSAANNALSQSGDGIEPKPVGKTVCSARATSNGWDSTRIIAKESDVNLRRRHFEPKLGATKSNQLTHFRLGRHPTMNTAQLIAALSLPLLASCSGFFTKEVPKSEEAAATSLHSLKVDSLDAGPVDLAKYKGQVLLVVNVASECGYTPQYKGLEALEQELSTKGFQVLGCPSNEFGGREPGEAAEIRKFCTEKYSVSFPMFAKSVTKPGPTQSPIFTLLGGATGKSPGWNFCKYLVGKDGKAIAFFDSKVKPDDAGLRAEIEKALLAAR